MLNSQSRSRRLSYRRMQLLPHGTQDLLRMTLQDFGWARRNSRFKAVSLMMAFDVR
jgi:hypothetical protein